MLIELKTEKLSIEEVFKVAFERNEAPTAIFNLDTTIAMANDAFCKISGFTREEVVGMSWRQQLPLDEQIRLEEYNRLRRIDPDNAPAKYEFSFYNKQGRLKHGWLSVSLLLNHDLLVVSLIDMTEKKKNDILLAKQSAELKDLIATRDKDITLTISQLASNKENNKKLLSKLENLKVLAEKNDKSLLLELNSLIEKLSTQQPTDSWEKINKRFQISYPEFIKNILKVHPNLTPAEIKLCALLRLNLDTKEIASIINISHDSIRTSRTRLRKKINLKANNKLVSYLMRF